MAVSFCGKRIILTRSSLLKTPRRTGYIVLVPEIGEDLPEKNPLFKEDGLPEFSQITIEKCIAAIGKQTVEVEQGLNNLEERIQKTEDPDVFKHVLNPLEDLGIPLETTWGVAKVLYLGNQSLMPTKCYLSIHDRSKRARATKFNSLPVYEACKKALETTDSKNELTEEQKRVCRKFILEGKLNGLELVDDAKKGHLSYSLRKLSSKRSEFRSKVEIATNQFTHTITDPNTMRDFPEEYLRTIAVDNTQPHRGPWNINLQPHISTPFLEYCPDRNLRWNVWQAIVGRCSLFNDRSLTTSSCLEDIRFNRLKQAQALGYKTYAHMSMETKMAGTVENVYEVLDTLLERARPAQEQELSTLLEFAAERGFEGTIQLWDIPYWSRKQLRSEHKYNEETLKEYFPLPKVLSGLFGLAERLFDIKIVERSKVAVWHEDVRFFDIFDSNSSTEPLGSFYLDPYARIEEKIRVEEESGWFVAIRGRSAIANTTPLSALVFNFQPPLYGKPSLLTFKDVQQLFQKFGLALQNLLTKTTYSEVSGTNNVEWDAVGISGHFMANWLYEPSTLKEISGHYHTGETLPEETVQCLRNIRTHLSGYTLCKELYFSRLDLELHLNEEFWPNVMKKLWERHFTVPLDKNDVHVCSFTDIFSGDWSAAYYSNIWSQMVAADAYSAFQEAAAEDQEQQKEIGKRFRDTFLSLGGSCPPGKVFRHFRGRDPSPKALLRNLNLKPLMKIE